MATTNGTTDDWTVWNCSSGTTSTAYSTNNTWTTWNTSSATDTNSSYYTSNGSSGVWETWVGTGGDCETVTNGTVVTDNGTFVWKIWHEEAEQSEEQREQWRREQEEHQRRIDLLNQEKEAAEQKAKELLMILIGPKELKVYEETGRVFVKGRNYDYMVHKGGRIDRFERDKITDLCCHLDRMHDFPETDNVVAVKLHIEANEEEFLRLANLHSSRELPPELPAAACM